MNSQLTLGVTQARQQELLRRAEQSRMAAGRTDRPSLAQRFARAIPSPGIVRRRGRRYPRVATLP